MGRIQFWILRGDDRLQLPVNPESVKISSPFGHEDVSVAQLGETTIIGERLPLEFSFESFFPRDYNPTYCEYSDIPDPWEAVKQIERFRDTRRQLRLTITGTPYNLHATIRDFQIEPERAGNPGDIYFSISLKEYKHVEIKKIKTSATATKVTASSPRPSSKPVQARTYTVKSGDSLWKISARHDVFGSGAQWRKLYEANKKVIGKNPNLIYPGQKLVIPK